MEIVFEILKTFSLPIAVAFIAIGATIVVYLDSRKERKERQEVMDRQNKQWLGLYKDNLEETANIRKEMSATRVVISELKGVISNLNEIVLKKLL